MLSLTLTPTLALTPMQTKPMIAQNGDLTPITPQTLDVTLNSILAQTPDKNTFLGIKESITLSKDEAQKYL